MGKGNRDMKTRKGEAGLYWMGRAAPQDHALRLHEPCDSHSFSNHENWLMALTRCQQKMYASHCYASITCDAYDLRQCLHVLIRTATDTSHRCRVQMYQIRTRRDIPCPWGRGESGSRSQGCCFDRKLCTEPWEALLYLQWHHMHA